MATMDLAKPHDKSGRSKLFSWMKRLTKTKSSTKRSGGSEEQSVAYAGKQHELSRYDRREDGQAIPLRQDVTGHGSFNSLSLTMEGSQPVEGADRSIAPTLATNPGTINSETVASDADRTSKSGTTRTLNGGISTKSAGGNSIFSSSNHSSRSLTTTLTTIQSAPSTSQQPSNQQSQNDTQHASQPSQGSTYFSHQYPTQPASAVPPYLNPNTHVPTTYRSATANNLLTDNASIITLASSSHRPHRRNSVDTNASIRAIAPSSVWGGSRESLPLSILSQSVEPTSGPTPPPTAGLSTARSSAILSSGERPGYGSGIGVSAPALSSERNSIYASTKPQQADVASLHDRSSIKASSVHADKIDTASTKSGVLGHARTSSIAGSIGGTSSPLVSKD